MDFSSKMVVLLRLWLRSILLIVLTVCIPSYAANFSSNGSTGSGPVHFRAEQIISLAKKMERTLAAKGARVAIIARIGRPPSEMPEGMHYTHVAFAVYSEITTSDGRHINGYAMFNEYQNDQHPDLSSLVQDYPVDFFAGVAELKAGIIIPSAELQKRLLEVIASPTYKALHEPNYSAIANPYTLGRQNCTEFVLDVVNAAIYQTSDIRVIKANENAFFVAQPVNVSPLKLMLGTMFSSEISMSDQSGAPVTATFERIADYIQKYDIGSEVLTITSDLVQTPQSSTQATKLDKAMAIINNTFNFLATDAQQGALTTEVMQPLVEIYVKELDPSNSAWNSADPKWQRLVDLVSADMKADLSRGAEEKSQERRQSFARTYAARADEAEMDDVLHYFGSEDGARYREFQGRITYLIFDGIAGMMQESSLTTRNPKKLGVSERTLQQRKRLLSASAFNISTAVALGKEDSAVNSGEMFNDSIANLRGEELDTIGKQFDRDIEQIERFNRSKAGSNFFRAVGTDLSANRAAFSAEASGDLQAVKDAHGAQWREFYRKEIQRQVASSSALQGEFVPIENWTATLVTARKVVSLGEVREITNAFNFEGRIHAHLTLSSRPGSQGGRPIFEAKWFNGDKLVSVQKADYAVSKSPYYLASSTSGTALGAGKCRVDLFANGKLLASKEFRVTEK